MIKLLLQNPLGRFNMHLLIKIVLITLAIFYINNNRSLAAAPDNDDCSGTDTLIVGAGSCSPVMGDVMDATQSMSACTGTADDDVWYAFTATGTYHIIKIAPSESFDAVIQLFSGTCEALTSIQCSDEFGAGKVEMLPWNTLNIGETYYFRVYHRGAAKPATTTFDVCVYQPTPPVNDDCAGAFLLNVGATCISSSQTTEGATDSGIAETCDGAVYPDDDVWFKFIAPSTGRTIIRVDGSKDFRPVIEVFDGCGGAFEACKNGASHNVIMTLELTGLTPGNTYYFRVFDFFQVLPTTLTFEVCLSNPPPPTNDNAAGATALTATPSCSYLPQTLNGATASSGHPAPCAGNPDDDLWYSFVPTTTRHLIKVFPSSGFDVVVQVLDGSGAGANVVKCANDSTMGDEEIVSLSGLTPGNTYYVRVFSFETSVTPTTSFEICSSRIPDNDDCQGARTITVSASGNIISDSVTSATMSMAPCAPLSSSEDDVWFKFVATSTDNSITVESSPGFDAVVELFDGCSGTSLACKNDSAAGQMEKIIPASLVIGNTYYVRVYDYYAEEPVTKTFNIYVREIEIAATSKAQVEKSLNIYPVPANNHLNVSFTTTSASSVMLKLISYDGKPMYAENLGQLTGDVSEKIDISGLNKGIYLLQIIMDKEVVSKKFVVN